MHISFKNPLVLRSMIFYPLKLNKHFLPNEKINVLLILMQIKK